MLVEKDAWTLREVRELISVNGGVKLSNYGGIKLTTNLKSFLQA